ncbi:MazG nucleotide pyrophosphohydrolase domain protein [Planctomycetes bacterium CA13]|uniref:MazG nucleotide pyrophosphohydrolase domain protein n=1 Tax=Novipirellula herctigrandis TaxID=2527986 RepID=A0A5C5Z7S0_9BACT|nr:MazG nucleotide pyrophosphohydrolase domain protein [Planctomycetes bacterium CA13]
MSPSPPPESYLSNLTIRDAQVQVDQWIHSIGVRYFDEMTNLAQLIEEVGEVARILSRTCGEQSWKTGKKPADITNSLADELADVLFVTFCLANQSGIDLTKAFQRNLDKKKHRDAARHQQNEKLQD